MNKNKLWRTSLDPRDPDYCEPEDEEFTEPDEEKYDPDIDYQGERE